MKILIVDDVESNVLLLELMLKDHIIDKAFNGKEALEKINSFQPDLVLLDIMMPVLDGISTLKIIRDNYLTSKLPVVIVTAKQEYVALREAMQAGASDYLKKPVDGIELKTIIELQKQLIESRKKIQEYEVYENIKESMLYAKRFQFSLLPNKNEIIESFTDCFILNKPKDIVSGDFYNFFKNENKNTLIVYDCLGHGVPASMMTITAQIAINKIYKNMPGSSLMNKIHLVLNELNENINKSQNVYTDFSLDGCFIEFLEEKMKAEYSSFSRPFFLVRKNSRTIIIDNNHEEPYYTENDYSLYRIRGNRYSFYLKTTNIITHTLQLEKGDCLYFFSDGYTDQMSGNFNEVRIGTKGFAKLLLQNQDKDMNEQKKILYNAFTKALSGTKQMDDILIIGVKL